MNVRGKKTLPRLDSNGMTKAAIKRFMVFTAAHNARLYHARAVAAGRKLSWRDAIERAIKPWADEIPAPTVTFEAVERQIFPRAADRKSATPHRAAELVLPRQKRLRKKV